MASRLNLSLDPEYAEKLSRLAELDGADPDATHIVQLLDGTPAQLVIGHRRALIRRGSACRAGSEHHPATGYRFVPVVELGSPR